jgi:hypothetical protein
MIKESNLEAFPYECEPLNTVPSESLPDMAPVRVDRQHDRQQDFLHSHHHASPQAISAYLKQWVLLPERTARSAYQRDR